MKTKYMTTRYGVGVDQRGENWYELYELHRSLRRWRLACCILFALDLILAALIVAMVTT